MADPFRSLTISKFDDFNSKQKDIIILKIHFFFRFPSMQEEDGLAECSAYKSVKITVVLSPQKSKY